MAFEFSDNENIFFDSVLTHSSLIWDVGKSTVHHVVDA